MLLGAVAFAGTAFADDDSGEAGSDRAGSSSHSRSDDSSGADGSYSGSDESADDSGGSGGSGDSGGSARSARSARGSRSGKSIRRADDNLPDNIVRGTPCTNDAVACVSLGAQRAWLFTDGQISYGPVPVSTGGPGKQTPVGDHVVQWKHKNHTTDEFKTAQGKPAPMPYAVFFAEGGVAFHEGTLNRRSAGCVRLTRKDAEFFYNFLKLGDKVEVRG
jgi:hypothetical protein